MPGFIVHVGAVVTCSHGAPAQPTASFPRVLVSGMPVVTMAIPYMVAGCPQAAALLPPCVTGQFTVAAVRVFAGGVPVVVQAGASVCAPTGTPLIVTATQTRVLAQ